MEETILLSAIGMCLEGENSRKKMKPRSKWCRGWLISNPKLMFWLADVTNCLNLLTNSLLVMFFLFLSLYSELFIFHKQ